MQHNQQKARYIWGHVSWHVKWPVQSLAFVIRKAYCGVGVAHNSDLTGIADNELSTSQYHDYTYINYGRHNFQFQNKQNYSVVIEKTQVHWQRNKSFKWQIYENAHFRIHEKNQDNYIT